MRGCSHTPALPNNTRQGNPGLRDGWKPMPERERERERERESSWDAVPSVRTAQTVCVEMWGCRTCKTPLETSPDNRKRSGKVLSKLWTNVLPVAVIECSFEVVEWTFYWSPSIECSFFNDVLQNVTFFF